MDDDESVPELSGRRLPPLAEVRPKGQLARLTEVGFELVLRPRGASAGTRTGGSAERRVSGPRAERGHSSSFAETWLCWDKPGIARP